jgi:geranylgeranyl reductase family protein
VRGLVVVESVDVLIVGGGPAGASAGAHAARAHPTWSIVILDKAAWPRDKVCGDGIGPDAVEELELLGARGILNGHAPLSRVHLRGSAGVEVYGRPPRSGYAIRRMEFDAGLLAHAKSSGVTVVQERLESLSSVGRVTTVNNSWRARHVIIADGANSRGRALLGMGHAPRDHMGFSVRGYMAHTGTDLEISWSRDLPRGYSWVFPLGDGTANVGVGVPRSALGSGEPKKRLWAALEAATGLPSDDPSLRAHHLPYTSARLSLTHGALLFVGDAGGLVNPLSGEGIYYALASGRLASDSLSHDDPASWYRGSIRREFGRHFFSTRAAYGASVLPHSIDATLRAGGANEHVFDDLVALTLGRGYLTARIALGVARHWVT